MEVPCVKRRPERERRLRGVTLLAVASSCALSVGCHRVPPVSQEEQVRTALNRFYASQPACLWTNAVRIEGSKGPSRTITAKEAHALGDAGLIDRERHHDTLTSAGRTFWREDAREPGYGNLCFGKWTVTRVDSLTPLHDDLFGNTMEARFDATIASPALWTRLPGVQAAFPEMARKVSQPLPHSATMRHTGKEWQIAVIATP